MTRDWLTAAEFRKALAELGISQQEFARRMYTNPRTVRRWALEETPIPRWVTGALELMLRKKLVPGDGIEPPNGAM